LQPHKVVIDPRRVFTRSETGSREENASNKNSTEPAMVKRTSFEHDDCPIARSLDAIGDWWSILIIREALFGVSRFGEFQKKLGLAKNILTVRLRALVDQGILKTAPASDGSAYQEYLLTPKGRGIFPILVALRQWSEEFDERPDEITTILVDKEKGQPVCKLELHSQDGRLLSASDTALKPRAAGKRGRRVVA
jgi:DNA-binding HxlR family transcriptional regulator